MTSVAYEKWFGAASEVTPHPVLRALHASRLDSFLADSQDDGVMVIDRDGRIIDANLSLSRRTGFARGEIIGRAMIDVVLPAHQRRIQAAIDDALGGDGVRARAAGIKRSGATCDLAITFVPLFDEQRAVVGSLVITQNLSEAAEAALERERDGALLALAGRIAGFIGWRLELSSRTLDWSGDLTGFEGRPPATLDGLLALLGPADAARFARALDRAQREQRQLDITIAVAVPAGERHLRLIGEPSKTGAGASGVMSGAAHDVTDAVAEQRQRREAEQLLSTTVNAMTDGLGIVDDAWRFTFVNDRLVEMIGLERDAILGTTMWQAVPELCGTEFEIAVRTAVAEGTTVRLRDRIEARDAWIEGIAYPSGGGLAVHVRDVTETELATQRYRRAQEELATLGGLLDISRDAIVVRDPEHRIRYANAGAIALYGWEADRVVGVDSRELVTIDPEQMAEAMRTVIDDGHWSGRVAVRTADGRDIVVSSRWQLMRDTRGEPEAVLSVSADVTDEIAREEALNRAERLESLGTFAGGIAHDLNNVLTPILMASQLLGMSLEGTPDRDTATMIETAARRGAEMVRQVLAFARGVETRAECIDLADLLAELRTMVVETLRPGVDLLVTTSADAISFTGDATQLLQVLANLVSNAHDAIGDSGTITVDARLEPAAGSVEPHIVIDVIDTGHGMTPEVIARLWEPFFTTKPVGEGTGLGLPMVASIMRGHGGSVEAHSDGATGSRFTVRLPVGQRATPVDRRDQGDPVVTPRGTGQRVLVVDDEHAIRTIVRQALETEGYEVLVASSGDDAWRHIQSQPAPPDLVLSDVTMAGGSGIDLVERLIDAGSGIPVVIMSGLEDRGSMPPEVTRRSSGFLVKPLSTPTLLLAVHDALTTDGPWRIHVIDDDALIATLVSDGLRLRGHAVTVAASPSDARLAIDDVDPHLLICDLNFVDGQSGAEFIAELRATRPWVACVVLSNHRSPELAVPDAHLLPHDVVYLVKSTVQSVDHILAAVHAAMTGRALEVDDQRDAQVAPVVVNQAQAQVLRVLASGASTRAVAEMRGTSVRAVESLLVRLYGTLGLDTSRDSNPRVEAIRMWQAGLVRVGGASSRDKARV